jgi:hypothetical protein
MNLIPTPAKYSSNPVLSTRRNEDDNLEKSKLHPISPERDKTLPSNSEIKPLNKHFQIKLNSKDNLDTFNKIERVKYPQTLKNDSQYINKGNLHKKLPKISKKMMTRYNLMNNIKLPYQDNQMRIYDPNMDYWGSENDFDQEFHQNQYFKNFNKNGHRVIDASRKMETVAGPKFATSRLHYNQDAYGGYDNEYPSYRKYRVHMPGPVDPQLTYSVPYQNVMRPFYYGDPGVKLIAYPSRRNKTKSKKRKRRKKERSLPKKKTKSRSRSKSKKRKNSGKREVKKKYYYGEGINY